MGSKSEALQWIVNTARLLRRYDEDIRELHRARELVAFTRDRGRANPHAQHDHDSRLRASDELEQRAAELWRLVKVHLPATAAKLRHVSACGYWRDRRDFDTWWPAMDSELVLIEAEAHHAATQTDKGETAKPKPSPAEVAAIRAMQQAVEDNPALATASVPDIFKYITSEGVIVEGEPYKPRSFEAFRKALNRAKQKA